MDEAKNLSELRELEKEQHKAAAFWKQRALELGAKGDEYTKESDELPGNVYQRGWNEGHKIGLSGWMAAPHGMLCDYISKKEIRQATAEEAAASKFYEPSGGSITVFGRECCVVPVGDEKEVEPRVYKEGNVVIWEPGGRKQAIYGANIARANEEQPTFVCAEPHEDGDLSYLCPSEYCRCSQ